MSNYQDTINQIIELRDQVYDAYDAHQTFKLKGLLDQIRELSDSLYLEDDQQQMLDKISVFEFLGDFYGECGRLQQSIECYHEAIQLGKRITDENRETFRPLADYYRHYIANRYLLDGNCSDDLDEELYEYLDEEGDEIKQLTLGYYQVAPKHDAVEDSEPYLAVIDAVEEKIYDQLRDHFQDADYQQQYADLKTAILKDEYGIDWHPPVAPFEDEA